nr:hypothetical protein [Hephaestia sp. MAHUQ-44]
MRVVMLWPALKTPAAAVAVSLPYRVTAKIPDHAFVPHPPSRRVEDRRPGASPVWMRRRGVAVRAPIIAALRLPPSEVARSLSNTTDTLALAQRTGHDPASLPLAPRAAAPDSRWLASGWIVLRGDGAPGAAFGGSQLGGSQAGARLVYTIDQRRHIALVGRVATPLRGNGREVALGVEWQPIRAPVRMVAEQRLAIDGGKGGPTIGVIGGVGPVAVAPGVTLEAYGQAGAIARRGGEGFADGAARLAHRVATIGGVGIDLGAGVWGAAQRDAARLDAGPSMAVDLSLGQRAHVRLSLDWRARLAGDTRPGSGPALSLGTDF